MITINIKVLDKIIEYLIEGKATPIEMVITKSDDIIPDNLVGFTFRWSECMKDEDKKSLLFVTGEFDFISPSGAITSFKIEVLADKRINEPMFLSDENFNISIAETKDDEIKILHVNNRAYNILRQPERYLADTFSCEQDELERDYKLLYLLGKIYRQIQEFKTNHLEIGNHED